MKQHDPNVPVLEFKCGGTRYQILIAGPNERINAQYHPRQTWGPNSMVVVEHHTNGIREVEHDLHDPITWGWIGRLMADRSIAVEQLSKNDNEILHVTD